MVWTSLELSFLPFCLPLFSSPSLPVFLASLLTIPPVSLRGFVSLSLSRHPHCFSLSSFSLPLSHSPPGNNICWRSLRNVNLVCVIELTLPPLFPPQLDRARLRLALSEWIWAAAQSSALADIGAEARRRSLLCRLRQALLAWAASAALEKVLRVAELRLRCTAGIWRLRSSLKAWAEATTETQEAKGNDARREVSNAIAPAPYSPVPPELQPPLCVSKAAFP